MSRRFKPPDSLAVSSSVPCPSTRTSPVSRCASLNPRIGPFERDEKLVSAGPMARDLEKKHAVLNFARFQRGAVDGGNFKTLGNGQGELSRIALHNIEIDQGRDLQIGFRYGNERFHIREETHFAGCDRRNN